MPLFQTSVLKKFLKQQDEATVSKAYKKFTKYFHNPVIQQNIRESKEEQFQQKFLIELFVHILGYVINPDPNYNLTTEFKNEKGAKKADGAILLGGKALGVIELKSTKTKDLEKVRQQAFDYKANQSGCVYVITSNFEKVRFYINNAVDFEEFDLFTLTQQQFALLYLCLHKDQLLNNIPLKIKEASVQEEEKITKKFYQDYSLFKRELYRDLVKLNMKNEVFRTELSNEDSDRVQKNIKLTLFKKSQKLIDRFLFIFFAEDRGLLPPNSTVKILDQWNQLKELDEPVPLYNRFKKYFNYLDTGRKGTGKSAEIFAYNGGLFKPDATLNSLLISDNLLHKHASTLSKYDFESQVDVNILGHIFENSLNEIESVNAEIEGGEFDKQKSKRKKDGVFYTPKYITKYIVDNTVGKLCEEKKTALKLKEEDFRANRQKETKKKLLALLESYREWLLQLTICDPACGSGAFLNQALDFLIKEHQYIDELQTKLLGGGFVFPNIENTVLENNIYGVDINEESVEIAKLSLWLRTAQPRRKLNDLSSNIKCGNSLIDSKAVAGDKAFVWEEEFPHIFKEKVLLDGTLVKSGGFDVVIGNPPYVDIKSIDWDTRRHFEKLYKTAVGRFDLYTIFIELAMSIKHVNGSFAFIVPGKILNNLQFKVAREFVITNHSTTVTKIDDKVFSEAQVDSVILINSNTSKKHSYTSVKLSKDTSEIISKVNTDYILKDANLIFKLEINENVDKIVKKIKTNTVLIKEIGEVKDGIVAGGIKDLLFHQEKVNDSCYKLYFGKNIKRYLLQETNIWVDYRPNSMMTKEVERKNGKRPGLWMRDKNIFLRNKIIYRKVGENLIATYVDKPVFYEQTIHSCFISDPKYDSKFILALFNSKLFNFYYRKINSKGGKTFPQVRISSVENLPIKVSNQDSQKSIIKLVEKNLSQAAKSEAVVNRFLKFFQSHTSINPTKKLQHWHTLSFKEFITELNKAIKKEGGEKLSKSDELEWMEVFETKKAEALALQAEIDKTDKEIDQMVYELYGLTEEEIKIVEES
jgi:tRNA1(Val) A37 N6-methylase TrmN6